MTHHRARSRRNRASYDLTEFELSCLRAAARGRTDFIIARLVDAEVADARKALKAVQAKFGVGNRVSMALKAVQIGFLTFNEALVE